MPGEVHNLFQCACGAPGRPAQVIWKGEVVASGPICPACLHATDLVLHRTRPIYAAMRSAGIDAEIANLTMTFLLDALDRAGEDMASVAPR